MIQYAVTAPQVQSEHTEMQLPAGIVPPAEVSGYLRMYMEISEDRQPAEGFDRSIPISKQDEEGTEKMTREEFQKLTTDGPLILDGATGSFMTASGMPKGVCTETWILEHPEILTELQKGYIAAGSDIIYAPTFGANRLLLKNYGLESKVSEINHDLVALSKSIAGSKAYVAGDVTTANRPDLDYGELYDVYTEQVAALADAGADLIVAETMISVDETLAVIDAVHAVCDLPVLCSLTMQADGSLFFGGTIFEAAPMLQEMGADAVGINCSTGPEQLESIIKNLHELLTVPVIAKPNAGMPTINDDGIAVYHMTTTAFAEGMKRLHELGATVIGGCCGTDPEFIRELVKTVRPDKM